MAEILILLLALAVCVSVHEFSHAWVAWKLGDPTAKAEGRVTLNPLRHLDPLGTLMILIAHFGWGKPVPVDERHFRHPKRDMALVSMAGPLSNLLTAFLIALFLKYLPNIPAWPAEALRAIYTLSIVLFLFNLLPIAPLDGSKFIGLLIPRSKDHYYQAYLAKGPIILILLIVGDRLLADVLGLSPLSYALQIGYEAISILIFLAT